MNYSIGRYVKTLELDKILELLANEASLADSKELARAILPETDIALVEKTLKETEDAYTFMSRYTAPSFGFASNVSSPLRRAQSSAVLSPRELLDIAETLRVIRSIKDWRSDCSGLTETTIDYLFDTLFPNILPGVEYVSPNLCIGSLADLQFII